MNHQTTLTPDELARMVTTIKPSWRIREATPAEAGHHPVYKLAVETSAGNRDCYLKATPPEKAPSVKLEGRLLAILDRHTDIPVPTVYGVVDDHDTLQAPFLLQEAMPGRTIRRTELPSFSDDNFRRIAFDTGRHLADLHAVDAVDSFGYLTCDGPERHGESPVGDSTTVTVADPVADWQDQLRDWATETCTALEETRFADIPPEAEPVLETEIDRIEGEFDPVLARIDNVLENVLLEDTEVRSMLDWEFTIAATPAYDIVNVAWSLAGGAYLFGPDVPDRRALIRAALIRGYRDEGSESVIDQVRANCDCYELLSLLRSMSLLEQWYQLFDLERTIDEAAQNLRTELELYC
jgi:aminoglycoside phosphotransferase (APT) family kinase protein